MLYLCTEKWCNFDVNNISTLKKNGTYPKSKRTVSSNIFKMILIYLVYVAI